MEALHYFDDVTRACADEIPALAGITAAAPDHNFRNAGVKIPRQTHRYSGRTAMRANISVHEPKQPTDEESPLGFTMEGLNRNQPGALLPFVWAPGWNSNQSLHRFQEQAGGPLKGGTAGTRLLQSGSSEAEPPGSNRGRANPAVPKSALAKKDRWQLVPRQRIFGSDELSALSPGIAELVEPGYIEISDADAAKLGVAQGDGLEVGDNLATLEVRINDAVAAGCAGFSLGLAGTDDLVALSVVDLQRAENWQRRPELIGSDRDAGAGGADV